MDHGLCLVATQEEADAALARLNAGEDFAALAKELSTDSGSASNGGDLGCQKASVYDSDFADATLSAELGTVIGPVQTQFGYHLIRVDSRTPATTQELIDGLTQIRLSDLAAAWAQTSVTSAEITVDPKYGTWQTDPTPTIVPPTS